MPKNIKFWPKMAQNWQNHANYADLASCEAHNKKVIDPGKKWWLCFLLPRNYSMWWNTSYIQILKFWKKCHVKITFLGQNWPKMVKNTCFCPKFVSLRYYSPINCTYPYVKLHYLSFDTQIIKNGESMEKWGLKEIPPNKAFLCEIKGSA